MAVENSWNPVIVAVVVTVATGLQAWAGFVGCDFIQVAADANQVLAITETSEQEALKEASIGLLCDGEFYELDDDRMRTYSRSFYFVALATGGAAALFAWAISTCLTPTLCAWRIMPGLSSFSALASLPTFLILESYPCQDFEEQSCSLSRDSYYLISAVALHILVTALTQFLDPPNWVSQLHHWRLTKSTTMDTTNQWSMQDEEDGSQEPILLSNQRQSFFSRRSRSRPNLKSKNGKQIKSSRPALSFTLPLQDIERGDSLVEEDVVSTQGNNDLSINKANEWTAFEPKTNSFRENDPISLMGGVHDTRDGRDMDVYSKGTTSDPPSRSPASTWPPVYLVPAEEPETDLVVDKPARDIPSTPTDAHHAVEQVPISPLTHNTIGTAQDPVVDHPRHGSNASPSFDHGEESGTARQLKPSETTSPVGKLDVSLEDSILDGVVNGNDSLLDASFERANPDAPFIPNADEARQMASLGYSVYAGLLKEEEIASKLTSAEPPQYNIDELINGDGGDPSTEDPILKAEDVKVIATEGTPIYASLLLEQEGRITHQFRNDGESASEAPSIDKPMKHWGVVPVTVSDDDLHPVKKENKERALGGKSQWALGTTVGRRTDGYNKLDNASSSDDEQEGPPMTEVSFDPNDMNGDAWDKDEGPIAPSVVANKVLMDDWNQMFDANGLLPVNTQVQMQQNQDSDDDEEDEAELLRLISSEDFSDESPKADDGHAGSTSSAPDKPPRNGGKTTLRPKRRARRSKKRGGGSVGSTPSLLDVTIEEETPSDLEDFGKEEENTIKNPLTNYSAESGNNNSNVASSVNMTGMHSYRNVEHHRTDELQQITSGVQDALKRTRGRSVSPERSSEAKKKLSRSLSPGVTRVSMWRSERENRGGIHDSVVVSSSDDEKESGTPAKDLRQFRIQRLQQGLHQPSTIDRARKRREKFFGGMQPSFGPSPTRAVHPSTRSTPAVPVTTTPPPSKPNVKKLTLTAQTVSSDDGSNTTTPDDVGEVGSFLIGALDLELNDLEASLAQLQREEGSEYGPDEHSI